MKPCESSAARDAQIERYLAENLPAAEKRIPEPMNPGCEVCVIIPAFKERTYILRPLASLACQKDIAPHQYEVIVVVNNPGPPPEDPRQGSEANLQKMDDYHRLLKDNRETLELIHFITNKNETVETTGIQLTDRERDIIQTIRSQGLRVFAIDKSSKGKTLPEEYANVGGARNRGVAEAVERFYKQGGRNGILAHTDADTWFDPYYIRNLINAFKDNLQLVGLAGVDEDILENPRDRESMKHFLWGQAKEIYLSMLHRLFFSEPTVEFIRFIGSNMASKAYETALCGGISQKPGGEDTQLAREMNRIGKTIKAANVVNFPIIRYSPRTTTGKGNRMVISRADEKKNGQLLVRSMESAFYLSIICSQLKEAKINQKTSRENLQKILTIENKPLLDEKDLILLSQHIHQFETCRQELLNPVLSLVVEKICESVDRLFPPQPIINASALLLNTYFRDEQLKKVFNEIKTQMITERKEALASLEDALAKIFENASPRRDIQNPEELLVAQLQNRQSHLISQEFTGKRYRIQGLTRLILMSGTKEEALELIKTNYMYFLFLPGDDPVLSVMFDLQALYNFFEKQAKHNN